MPVERETSGRRSIELSVDVPGTPEQVWQAIATGPGITAWFVPTEVEEREGGAVVFHLGAGMDSPGTVTVWEPPVRFAYEERDWGPEAPPLATELVVEARAGGLCTVRLVHSLFASGDDWDGQLEGFEAGWWPYFHVLRLYLRELAGEPCSGFRFMAQASGTEEEAWAVVSNGLGLGGAVRGGEWTSSALGEKPVAGTVETIGEARHPHVVLLRLDEPAPGAVLLGAFTWGGSVHVMLSLYLYGERGRQAAPEAEAAWQSWMESHWPASPS